MTIVYLLLAVLAAGPLIFVWWAWGAGDGHWDKHGANVMNGCNFPYWFLMACVVAVCVCLYFAIWGGG